jgi:hypothetical protein
MSEDKTKQPQPAVDLEKLKKSKEIKQKQIDEQKLVKK